MLCLLVLLLADVTNWDRAFYLLTHLKLLTDSYFANEHFFYIVEKGQEYGISNHELYGNLMLMLVEIGQEYSIRMSMRNIIAFRKDPGSMGFDNTTNESPSCLVEYLLLNKKLVSVLYYLFSTTICTL